jgi:hypothetical protein
MKRLFAALVLLCAGAAFAEDVIVLTNGREARGKIVEETDAGVRLQIGGGKMFYPRAAIREIRRDEGEDKPAEPPPAPTAGDARDEYGLLYQDGKRVGTRTFRVAKAPEGWRFEEEIVFLDEKGAPEMQVRTVERADANFLPISFQVRESAGESEHRMSIGEVRGGRLYLGILKDGAKTAKDEGLPAPDARFPFAARELFLRESKALDGKLEARVFDTRDERWRKVSYSEGGMKPVDENGRPVTVRVVVRRRGEVVEREWLDEKLMSHMTEMNGDAMRSIASSVDVVGRLKRGDSEKATGPDSVARARYADAEAGWSIGKPDPSWTFEAPAVRGAGALLSVKNGPLFASVDVMRDLAAPPDTTVERAAESLQRLCRSIAEDFRVVKDGYVGKEPDRLYWIEATATTKGEKTRTIARVLVKKGKVWRLLAACPAGTFETLRPDFEKILDSFKVE